MNRKFRWNWKNITLYFVMLLLGLFLTGPFLWLLSTSFKSSGEAFQPKNFGDFFPKQFSLENFRNVWFQLEGKLPRFFLSTIIIVGIGISLELLIAALAAYPLARLEFPGKGLIMFLLLSTMMLPSQANMIVNFITIRKLGLFDTYLAVILPSAVSVFGIFLMRQAYLVIPREIEDAARIDGCGELQIWYKIMLPLTRPAMASLAIFSFVGFWNSFMWPLVILKTESRYPLAVGLSYLANMFASNYKLIAAGSVLSMIPILIIFMILQKQFIAGITAGAVKN